MATPMDLTDTSTTAPPTKSVEVKELWFSYEVAQSTSATAKTSTKFPN